MLIYFRISFYLYVLKIIKIYFINNISMLKDREKGIKKREKKKDRKKMRKIERKRKRKDGKGER